METLERPLNYYYCQYDSVLCIDLINDSVFCIGLINAILYVFSMTCMIWYWCPCKCILLSLMNCNNSSVMYLQMKFITY